MTDGVINLRSWSSVQSEQGQQCPAKQTFGVFVVQVCPHSRLRLQKEACKRAGDPDSNSKLLLVYLGFWSWHFPELLNVNVLTFCSKIETGFPWIRWIVWLYFPFTFSKKVSLRYMESMSCQCVGFRCTVFFPFDVICLKCRISCCCFGKMWLWNGIEWILKGCLCTVTWKVGLWMSTIGSKNASYRFSWSQNMNLISYIYITSWFLTSP